MADRMQEGPALPLSKRISAAWSAARGAWRAQAGAALPAQRAGKGADPARLPDLITALDTPLVLLAPDLRIVACSRGAARLMPSLAAGKAVSLALRDPDALAALEQTVASGEAMTVEITEVTPPERAFRLASTRLSVEGVGLLVVLSIEDLSAIRAIERLRVDFIANASHELRTPLATLLGFIETLQGPAREDAAARERFLAIMNEQGRRMSRLVDDLLSLSRIEQRAHQPPAEKVDLSAIVREIIDSLSVMASERGVVVTAPPAGTSLPVIGDRDELLRLAENLIENAIKYGRDGKRVEVSLASADGMAELSVRDFGPGIAPEHIPRLTERFYRIDVGASRETGGTGLGLAIVKHIVLRHRGRMQVDSQPGQGACFRVSLPLFIPAPA